MTRAENSIITTSFKPTDITQDHGGVPRMIDVALGYALGFTRPRKIREIIERHHDSIKRFGEVVERAVKNPSGVGRPSQAYYLNKKQALYICTKSDTPNATEVTIQMVEVFDAYMSGKPIKVSEHNRRTSVKVDDAVRLKTNIDRLEKATQRIMAQSEMLCAVNIHGTRLIVDLADHAIRKGDYALIIDHHGDANIQSFDEMQRDVGQRNALCNSVATHHGGVSRDIVTVVGKVVTPYPDIDLKVLTLMASGPWNNAQIANSTGASIDYVKYVRRRVFEISEAMPRFASQKMLMA